MGRFFEKHPTDGTITVSAAQQGGMVRVSVADTGAGISPQEMQTLFQRYRTKKRREIPAPGWGCISASIL
ncbi:sensor histidine kinase [Ruthenibacterium lactatiformans]|uniref:ATP-binding protein n=1 Tax=Ruthenibacterium lactatiformans TaxID=1550024 RepID=UPI00196801EB|nr:sensor histidine kinase [Ruthenibacterium lactatiformans]